MTNKYNNKMSPMVPASLENSEQEMQMMSNNVVMPKMDMDSVIDKVPMEPTTIDNSQKPMQMIVDIPQFSKEQLKSYLDLVQEQCKDSIRINDFDYCIIGYDEVSNAIIYDGDLIEMELVHAEVEEIYKYNEEDYDIDDAYDTAYEMVEYYFGNGLIPSIQNMEDNKDRPKPIILRRFFI